MRRKPEETDDEFIARMEAKAKANRKKLTFRDWLKAPGMLLSLAWEAWIHRNDHKKKA